MGRLGLGPDSIHIRNPRLVYACMTGWGQWCARRQASMLDGGRYIMVFIDARTGSRLRSARSNRSFATRFAKGSELIVTFSPSAMIRLAGLTCDH